jgi:urease accessory protein
MPRAINVIATKERGNRVAADTVLLDFTQRSSVHGAVTSASGRTIDLDLSGGVRLRTDDLLVLEDGAFVEVVAAVEPLLEARAADLAALARIAWHLGDRHIQAELLTNRIRARREPEVEKLLAALGAKVAMIEAPFEPEGGAYAPQTHDHHDHGHRHDHDHHHGHDHKHRHD